MITALEYIAANGAQLRADKNMTQLNAWHLATVQGTGADFDTIGAQSYGVAGQSYNGIDVAKRTIEATLYADGFHAAGCQQLLDDASRIVAMGDQAIGLIKLTTAAGRTVRTPARIVSIDVDEYKRRTAKVNMAFDCPYVFFDDEVLQSVPLYALTGGKQWALQRPYKFADLTGSAGSTVSIHCINDGDTPAPILLKVYGAGISNVSLTNTTTGAILQTRTGSGLSTDGLEISTDYNDLYARFYNGNDASAYVNLYYNLSDFVLRPGDNLLQANITATSITQAACCIEYRGRYGTCL